MPAGKPVILIISGGWHLPEHYAKLTKALEAVGHEVHCPGNPSMTQVRPPTAGLAQDSENVRLYAEKLADSGRQIVALMHSYGGQVGTNSLHGLGVQDRSEKGLSGGVSHLVYMCAFALPEGGSMAGLVNDMGHEALMPIAFDFAEDMTVLCRDPKGMLVGAHDDDKELQEYVDSLQRWNGQGMYDAISHSAWREIPVTYIFTTSDMTIPFDYQKSMVASLEEQGRSVQTYSLETGHCPNLTATASVVDVVNKVVS
ncbi:putative hydrolase R7-like protein [Cladobotryum mycophilum]|uniref:Hydrolase R7-like protein n=1 Tax=Cladobotryum mycophilum TaxID=491253 RepID=A0ABR0SVW9_9HYPO